jgi:cysteinyl-tRNA synthetase
MKDINKFINAEQLSSQNASVTIELYKKFDEILKVLNIDELKSEEKLPAEVEELLIRRKKAREAKDFAESDTIRDKLKSMGWIVEDSPKGQKIKKA